MENQVTEVKEKKKRNKSKIAIIVLSVVVALFVLGSGVAGYFVIANNYGFGAMSKEKFFAKAGDISIPIIEVNTYKKKKPKNKVDYVNCSFKIYNCEDKSHNFSVDMADEFDNEDDGEESVGIRLRGNSTMGYEKKPYRIKFEEKHSLLGLEENKSWVLLADYIDQSNIRNYAAQTLAGEFDGLDFAVTPNHVVFILNGKVQGLYLLCEQVDENSGRTDVKDKDVIEDKTSLKQGYYQDSIKDFPFLIEMNRLEGSIPGDLSEKDLIKISGLEEIEIKYPENDERIITKDGEDRVYDYIKEYMSAVWTTLKTGSTVEVSFRDTPVEFSDLVDVDSFVDFWLLNEIMNNPDSFKKSVYMHKTTDGKLKFGPVWDFDWSMHRTWFEGPYETTDIESSQKLCLARHSQFFKTFLKNADNYELVADRYDEIKHHIIDVSNSLSAYKSKINKIAELDAIMWYGKKGANEFDVQYEYVRIYLLDRYRALDKIFDKTHADFLKLI